MPKIQLKEIDVKNIKPNPAQPRERFDKEKLNELSESIKQVGLVHPIIVEEKENGKFQLISGERRWNAHKIAKKDKVISLVKKYDAELQKKKELLAANLNREDLADFEEWSYIKAVALDEGWVHNDGKGKGSVDISKLHATLGVPFDRMRMLKATFEGTTKELQNAVKEGKIATSDAQSVSTLEKDEQKKLAKEALSRDEGMRRSEIRSTIKEIKADKIKEEYGVDSFKTERTEQEIINDVLTDLSNFGEHFNEIEKRGIEMFDNSSLRRVMSSMVVKFSNIMKLFNYGLKPDKRFLKLVNYGKGLSEES